MIKRHQIETLGEFEDARFNYIAAIAKPQIARLIDLGTIHMDLFDNDLAEVRGDDATRYVLRRNPARVLKIQASRKDKLASLRKKRLASNRYLGEHRRASLDVARRNLARYAAKLGIAAWIELALDESK
ncbi:MAG: hypothetical protein BWZ10_01204 [candidate division BRC1 bacterium ADurb.BinA364]|nr:MAG: hypothetical protein BWZ10_01204 [candidate division BRC1 bacterium ADurb.BinA364]